MKNKAEVIKSINNIEKMAYEEGLLADEELEILSKVLRDLKLAINDEMYDEMTW